MNEANTEFQIFEKTFLQSIEKAQASTVQNVALNSEAMAASLLLVIKLENDLSSGKDLTSFSKQKNSNLSFINFIFI